MFTWTKSPPASCDQERQLTVKIKRFSQIYAFTCTVIYRVLNHGSPATFWAPAEGPEVEIVSITLDWAHLEPAPQDPSERFEPHFRFPIRRRIAAEFLPVAIQIADLAEFDFSTAIADRL